MEEPTMLELSVQKGHTLTICGDTHGIPLVAYLADRKDNFTMFWKSSEGTDNPRQHTIISSTETL